MGRAVGAFMWTGLEAGFGGARMAREILSSATHRGGDAVLAEAGGEGFDL